MFNLYVYPSLLYPRSFHFSPMKIVSILILTMQQSMEEVNGIQNLAHHILFFPVPEALYFKTQSEPSVDYKNVSITFF